MKIKTILLIILFLVIPVGIETGMKTLFEFKKDTVAEYDEPMTLYDYYLQRMFNNGIPDAIDLYVLERCIIEKVNPLEILSILFVENPTKKVDACNTNYKIEKKYNKKTKKYYTVKIILSQDRGLFQLNSKYIDKFIQDFWIAYGETEEFDINNYQHNTRVAVRLYKWLCSIEQFKGKGWYYPVMSYNAGYGSVLSKKVPFKTSHDYVQKFIEGMARFSN